MGSNHMEVSTLTITIIPLIKNTHHATQAILVMKENTQVMITESRTKKIQITQRGPGS